MKYAPTLAAILLVMGFLAWKYVPKYKLVRTEAETMPATNAPAAGTIEWYGSAMVIKKGTNAFQVELGFRQDGLLMWRPGKEIEREN
jgi:hypothetical protein